MSSPVSQPSGNIQEDQNGLDKLTLMDSKNEGRSWSKLAKSGGRILKGLALGLLAVGTIATLAVGILALVNPAGLAAGATVIGAGVVAIIAFGAENAIAVVAAGAVGALALGIIGAVSIYNRHGKG